MFPLVFTIKWLTGKFWKLYHLQSSFPFLVPSHKIHTHHNSLLFKIYFKTGSAPGKAASLRWLTFHLFCSYYWLCSYLISPFPSLYFFTRVLAMQGPNWLNLWKYTLFKKYCCPRVPGWLTWLSVWLALSVFYQNSCSYFSFKRALIC